MDRNCNLATSPKRFEEYRPKITMYSRLFFEGMLNERKYVEKLSKNPGKECLERRILANLELKYGKGEKRVINSTKPTQPYKHIPLVDLLF